MNEIMEAHNELTKDLERVLYVMEDDNYEELPDYLKEPLVKNRNRLEMLLEVLEEDPLYERIVL